ncbi:3-dehydroquinate synthase [Candidatus Omnitrophota bacterium]
MKEIKVALDKRSYKIFVGSNALSTLGQRLKRLAIGEDAVVITNAKIKRLLGVRVQKLLSRSGFSVRFELVPDTEKSKSQLCAFKVINAIARFDVKKRIFVIVLGGGVVGDLGGFVAAIYKRGVSYVQIPTTLLAQVDSAIGGKVAIDLDNGKNLAGAFYQPRAVVSDVGVLSTLSRKQIRAGLAEVIKYAVIKDRFLFDFLERNAERIMKLDKKMLEFIVCRCSAIKARIIEVDERETKGIRTILNYGHTIGHAIEAAGKYGLYNHGEAVSIGMMCAADIAVRLGLLQDVQNKRINSLLSAVGLPTRCKGVTAKKILSVYQHDKKFINKKNRFVLPTAIGKVVVYEAVPQDIVREVVVGRIEKKRY